MQHILGLQTMQINNNKQFYDIAPGVIYDHTDFKEFEEKLIKDRHSKVTNGCPWTPFVACSHVISKVPVLDGNILVIANMEFAITLKTVFNIDPSNITFVALCDYSYSWAQDATVKKILQGMQIVNCVNDNFLEMEFEMKFDVILGNPPYQKTNENGHAIPISARFTKRVFDLIKDDGTIGFITTNTCLGPGQQTIMPLLYKYKSLYISPVHDGKKYFPKVSQGICVFLVQKTIVNSDVLDINLDIPVQISQKDFRLMDAKGKYTPYIPKGAHADELALIQKIQSTSTDDMFQFRHAIHRSNDSNKILFGFITNRKTRAMPVSFTIREPGYEERHPNHPCGIEYDATEEQLKSVFCSYIFHWLIEKVVGGGAADAPANLSYFPKLQINKVYTHTELVALFHITNKENDLIMEWANNKPKTYWNTYTELFNNETK